MDVSRMCLCLLEIIDSRCPRFLILRCLAPFALRHPRHRRLPIVSFMVAAGGRFLHYNFVVALLNDLFGVQTRGGCACAGPYGQRLLGISRAWSRDGK